jgi:hypothetical protein
MNPSTISGAAIGGGVGGGVAVIVLIAVLFCYQFGCAKRLKRQTRQDLNEAHVESDTALRLFTPRHTTVEPYLLSRPGEPGE